MSCACPTCERLVAGVAQRERSRAAPPRGPDDRRRQRGRGLGADAGERDQVRLVVGDRHEAGLRRRRWSGRR